jgi:hypothetical protein
MRTTISIVLLGAVAAFVGCQKGDTGGPGNSAPPTNPLQKIMGKTNTFTLEPHQLATNLKQGEKKEFEIDIARKEFKEAVDFKFEVTPPKGVKADFAVTELKDPETKLKGYVEADAAAAPGEYVLKVTGTAKSGGDPVHVDYKIEVKAK